MKQFAILFRMVLRLLRTIAWFALYIALLGTGLSIFASLYVIAATHSSIYYAADSIPKSQVALVLGASIRSNGSLSPVLEERADAAVALYTMHKVSKILVSGDNGSLQHDEVYPVGKYLLSKGIPEGDIFLDYAGFDTYSSMYRAKNIFGVTSMIITSQRFHLPRALYIARELGLDAVGLDASAPGDHYFENATREVPATVKALFDLATRRKPEYLGPQFFVTGDGAATWVGPKAEMIYFVHGQ